MNKALHYLRFSFLFLCGVAVTSISNPGGAARAAGWECPSKPAEISLKRVVGRTKLYRTHDIHNLTGLHAKSGAVKQGMFVNGLGGGKIGMEGTTAFTVLQRGNQACIWLKSLDAKFFAYPSIHIAKNFPKGTCEFNAVLEHEKQHIRKLKAFHEEYAPHFKTELRRIAARLKPQGPMDANLIEKAQAEMNHYINTSIDQFNAKIMETLERRQNLIDSPEEYDRVNAQCSNWHRYK